MDVPCTGALYLLPAMLERLLDIIIPPLKYVILAFCFYACTGASCLSREI